MTSEKYVRVDLQRYVKTNGDKDMISWFKFDKRIVGYAYFLILICTTTITEYINVFRSPDILVTIANGILWTIWVRNSILGDVVIYMDNFLWRRKFMIEEDMDVYTTKDSYVTPKAVIRLLYWIIYIGLFAYLIYLAIGYKFMESRELTLIMTVLFQLFMVLSQRKHIYRRLNFIFGV